MQAEIEYIDVVERMNTANYFGKAKGMSAPVALPIGEPLDIYVSGFSCKDNSLTNRFRSPVVTTDRAGESRLTMEACMKTILAMLPKFAMLENPYGCPNDLAKYMQEKLAPHYHVACFRMNTMDLGLDTSKPRKWFVAQLQDKVSDGMHLGKWAAILEKFLTSSGPLVETKSFLLSKECKLVKEHFTDLRDAAIKAQSKEKSEPEQASGPASHGSQPKWKKSHETARKEFRKLGIEIPIPERGPGVVKSLSITDAWGPLYAEREHDLITILQEQAAAFGTDWMTKHLHWDISAPSEHAFPIAACDDGKVACLLTQHKIYNSALERHLLAVEHLLQAGFPLSKAMWLIPDTDLRRLAANSMSIPSIAIFLAFGILAIPQGTMRMEVLPAATSEVNYSSLTTGRVLCTSVSDGGSRYEVKLKGLGGKSQSHDPVSMSSSETWTRLGTEPLPPELAGMWVPGAKDLVFKFESPAETAQTQTQTLEQNYYQYQLLGDEEATQTQTQGEASLEELLGLGAPNVDDHTVDQELPEEVD